MRLSRFVVFTAGIAGLLIMLNPGHASAITTSAKIRSEILSKVEKDPNFGSYDLDITARQGEVFLRGVVLSERDKDALVRYAMAVKGVQSVTDYTMIGNITAAEESLTHRIRDAVARELKIENYDLKVRRQNNHVTLSGAVANAGDSARIERIALDVSGVKKVENNLEIRPSMDRFVMNDTELLARVEDALKESGDYSPKAVTLRAENGVIRLEGSLPSHRAVDKTLSVVLMVPGVKDVDSGLKVQGRPYPKFSK